MAAELEQARAQLSRLQGERAQLKAQADQHIRKIRDELTTSTQRKIAELQTALMQEEERRTELERRLSDAESKSASLDTRKELANAQQRLLELQGLLQKERREKDAWQKRAGAAENGKRELEARIDALETALAHANEQQPRKVEADADTLVAERDQLKADLASMKKKLVAAENAIEAAASLRAKVVRLEAALKGKR